VREPRRRSEPWGLFAVAAKLVVAGNGLRLLHVTLTYPLLVERRSTVSLALLSAVEDDGRVHAPAFAAYSRVCI
jgi:hypothetical protein